jgi:hypothetical protein
MAFPSTFLSLQDQVISVTKYDSTNRQNIKDFINLVYARVCVETEALQKADTMTLTPNVASYTIDTAILRMKTLAAAPPGGGYGPPLQQASLDEIVYWRQTGAVSPIANQTSTYYALVGMNELELYPTPSTADTLLMYYVYLPTPLAADADVPVLQEPYATDLLKYGAAFEAAADKSDPAAADWHTLYEDAKRRFVQHLNRRKGGGTGQMRVQGTTPRYLRRDIDVGVI